MIDIFDEDVIRAALARRSSDAARTTLEVARSLLPQQLAEEIGRAGLTGKGGAGFPVARKLDLVRRQAQQRRTLVVNGSEHEPGSLKDRYLLQHRPTTVLKGALIMAHAMGARRVRIAVNQDATEALAALAATLAESAACGWLQGEGGVRDVALVAVPDLYIVGEETALLEVLQGRPPLPTKRPPYPVECGLDGDATLVHNVETVAQLPFIVAGGAEAYRTLGVDGHGACLCTFGPEFARSGVQLVPMGISIRDLVYGYGGGLHSGAEIKAVQTGGPSAGFLTSLQLDVRFDGVSLQAAGSAIGCAAIRAFAHDDDMVAVIADLMAFFAKACCGQCPACRMETQMLASITKQTLGGKGNAKLLAQISKLLQLNAGKGICGLIAMPASPALSGLQHFAAEFDAYFAAAASSPSPAQEIGQRT